MIPKFRAWDKKVKEMIEDVTSIHFKTEMIATSNLYFYPCKDIELMQSTGLKDKNGKEIYEGDIVIARWWNIHGDHERVMLVEWNENKLGWNLINKSSTDMNYEVIGNIHEHPGLLVEEGK